MTPIQFAYWLQGFSELNGAPPSAEQWQAIRDHLALVFNKVTPDYTIPVVSPLQPIPPAGSPPWGTAVPYAIRQTQVTC